MSPHDARLAELGWNPFFSAQLSGGDADLVPVRVMAVHRGKISVAGAASDRLISPRIAPTAAGSPHATVGDWLLIDEQTSQISRILDRSSLFERRTPSGNHQLQLIAANVHTVFVVASCNQDFNLARIERYLLLAGGAAVTPVVVLTKADLADAPDAFADAARGLQPGLQVELVNAKDPASAARLRAWCAPGKTVALLGSSGVGKSTLINTLTNSSAAATQPVREGDGKGRHTTTVRQMHRLDQGGWLMDTPGMRELQLTDTAEGLAEVFDDIAALARECRFSNCGHQSEPDCAVQAALTQGVLGPERLARWRKLTAEDAAGARPGRRGSPS